MQKNLPKNIIGDNIVKTHIHYSIILQKLNMSHPHFNWILNTY